MVSCLPHVLLLTDWCCLFVTVFVEKVSPPLGPRKRPGTLFLLQPLFTTASIIWSSSSEKRISLTVSCKSFCSAFFFLSLHAQLKKIISFITCTVFVHVCGLFKKKKEKKKPLFDNFHATSMHFIHWVYNSYFFIHLIKMHIFNVYSLCICESTMMCLWWSVFTLPVICCKTLSVCSWLDIKIYISRYFCDTFDS